MSVQVGSGGRERVVDRKLFDTLCDGKPHDCYSTAGWARYVLASRLSSVVLPDDISATEVPDRGAIWSAADDVYTVTNREKLARVFAMEHALTGAGVSTGERIEAG